MNRVLSKVFIGVFFLPFVFTLCSYNNVSAQHMFWQTIDYDSVSQESGEVVVKLEETKENATYLIQHGPSLLDSLNGTGKEGKFTFPASALKAGHNVLQVTEKAPGHLKMFKVTVKGVQERYEMEEASVEQSTITQPSSALVFPNPTTTSFVIHSEEPVERVEIYSSTGSSRKVLTQRLNDEISVADLPNGIYTLRIFNGLDVKEAKLIKH